MRIKRISDIKHLKIIGRIMDGPSEDKVGIKSRIIGRMGIRSKLIISFTIPIIFLIVLGMISYNKAASGLVSSYEDTSIKALQMTAKYIEFGLDGVEAATLQYVVDQNAKKYITGVILTEYESGKYYNEKSNEFFAKVASEQFYENMYLYPSEGVDIISSAKSSIPSNFDEILQKEAAALQNTDHVWLAKHPTVDESQQVRPDSYAFSYLRKYDGYNAGVIVDISKDIISETLTELSFGVDSYVGYVIDGMDEITIIGRTEEQDVKYEELKEVDDFQFNTIDPYTQAMEADSDNGFSYYEVNGTNYLFMYNKISDTGMSLCALVPSSSIMKQANDIKTVTIWIVLIACIIACIIGLTMSMGISGCIRMMKDKLTLISKGDLTIKIKVNRSDEFSDLADGINEMVTNVRDLITTVQQVGGLVTESSDKVDRTSVSISTVSEMINNAIVDIEKGVGDQAEDAQDCLMQMDELSKKIITVNENLSSIVVITDRTNEHIAAGIKTMDKLTEKSVETDEITKFLVNNMMELEQKSNAIENIVTVINEIANQTNLLSLNASIEAARAGEKGLGFAVVAEEIRRLAEQSAGSAKKIKMVIGEITKQTIAAVKSAKDAALIVGDQNNIVMNTKQTFGFMNEGMVNLVESLQLIANDVNNMDVARAGTLQAIENISAVSEETFSATSTVMERLKHQAEHVTAMTGDSQELSHNAQDLKKAIDKFKL